MIWFSGGTGSQKSQVIIHSTASPGTALKRHGEGSGSKGSMVRSAHADHNSNEDKVWQRRVLRAMAMDMDRGPRLIHRLHLTIKHQNFSHKLKKWRNEIWIGFDRSRVNLVTASLLSHLNRTTSKSPKWAQEDAQRKVHIQNALSSGRKLTGANSKQNSLDSVRAASSSWLHYQRPQNTEKQSLRFGALSCWEFDTGTPGEGSKSKNRLLKNRTNTSGWMQNKWSETLQFDIDFNRNRNNDWKKPSGLGQGNFNGKRVPGKNGDQKCFNFRRVQIRHRLSSKNRWQTLTFG